jgi:hypothetical protein
MNYIVRHAEFTQDGQRYKPGDVVDISQEEYDRNPRLWEPVPHATTATNQPGRDVSDDDEHYTNHQNE